MDFFQGKKQKSIKDKEIELDVSNPKTIYDLYYGCVKLGMNPTDFWTYSLDEVDMFFDKVLYNRKEQLNDIQTLATLITNGVAICLNGSDKVQQQTVFTMHKDLFSEDIEISEKKQKENELKLHKAKMNAFMNRFNNQKGGING